MKRSVVIIVVVAFMASIFLTGFAMPGGGISWGAPLPPP
jgi:hypothetical protein